MQYEIVVFSRITTLTSSTMYTKKSLIIFKLTHIISLLVGLAPYTINISPCSSKKTGFNFRMTYSIVGCAYNVLLLFVFVGITVFLTPGLVEWQYADSSVSMLVSGVLTTIGNVTSIIVIFHYVFYHQQSILIGNQLSQFDEKYGSKLLHMCENDNSSRLKNLQHWRTMFLFLLIWCGVFTTSAGAEHSLAKVASFFSVLVLSCLLMQYSSTVDELRGRFEHLNEILPMIFKRPIPSLSNSLVAGNVLNHYLITKNFLTFRQARTMLYKTSCLIAEFYSFPVLLTIFYSFCSTIDIAYYLLFTIVEAEKFTVNLQYINCFFWFLVSMYPTVMLSKGVRRFNKEMHKTADIIYDIMEMHALNKEVEHQLNIFATELMHKKVEFTACGFFSLDCTLLQSIFGAFVTYLLILLQLKPKDGMEN